ncbi:hypothetical protein pEaSNUABM9_00232 [Erwinia phage pEa_SNUABM_9]|nr:hypothetical protein pEaSNUABM9_00232 [Erwinia phage pEa_SNUABM_9]
MLNWIISLINKRQRQLLDENQMFLREHRELKQALETSNALIRSLVIKNRHQGDLINYLGHYQKPEALHEEIERLRKVNRDACDIGYIAMNTINRHKEQFNVK